ncbi:MAG: YybH family protein [Verrucomicrobiales bacterium]
MNRRESITAGLAGVTAIAALSTNANAQDKKAESPELEAIRAVFKAHDVATGAHDLDGVVACFAPDGVMMGSGPGELWSGAEEIKDAYTNIFKSFDKGEQDFHYNFRFGGLSSEMGWLVASGEVNGKKDGKKVAFPLNVSLTMVKKGGKWMIAAMHFSTLTGAAEAAKK